MSIVQSEALFRALLIKKFFPQIYLLQRGRLAQFWKLFTQSFRLVGGRVDPVRYDYDCFELNMKNPGFNQLFR